MSSRRRYGVKKREECQAFVRPRSFRREIDQDKTADFFFFFLICVVSLYLFPLTSGSVGLAATTDR